MSFPIRAVAASAAFSLFSTLVAQAGLAVEAEPTAPADARALGVASIRAEDLRKHAFFFAGDECEGRFTSTKGQRLAAEYIAKHLESLGFEPLGDLDEAGKRSFFQTWPIEAITVDERTALVSIAGEDAPSGFALLPGSEIGSVDVEGEILDCGYGARSTLPETIEKGQIPFVMLRTKTQGRLPVEAQMMTGIGALQKAQAIASQLVRRGAPCVIFGVSTDDSGLNDFLNYAGMAPGKPLIAYDGDNGVADLISGRNPKNPCVFLSRDLTARVLRGLGHSIEGDAVVRGEGDPKKLAARVRLDLSEGPSVAWNVCAVLKGSDPQLAAEAVVYSAHMDHMGKRHDGKIFRGADDNASGSSALCEVAEAFAKSGPRRRSVIFLAVAGEEEGLWGSKFYSENPTWPVEQLVANINIDMIGRIADLSGADEISITPSDRHRKFSSIGRLATDLAGAHGLSLTNGDKFYERSDHYNFATKGIPVVFFCDGEHEDYHQVTDSADKLEYGKIERVARLAFDVGVGVADAADRPTVLGRQ
ncbi:MAG: M28 family peptidase [Planctomycetota bacterium]